MDFVSDRLVDGRWFRILTVVDQYTRECLCAHADRSQTQEEVSAQLERVRALRGAPEAITSDNGSEFAGQAMDYWAHQVGVKLDFIHSTKCNNGNLSHLEVHYITFQTMCRLSVARSARIQICLRVAHLSFSRGLTNCLTRCLVFVIKFTLPIG